MNLSLFLIKHDVMKYMGGEGGGDKPPCDLKVGTRLWLVSGQLYEPIALPLRGKKLLISWTLGGLQRRYGCCGEEKTFPPRPETSFLITILNRLSAAVSYIKNMPL